MSDYKKTSLAPNSLWHIRMICTAFIIESMTGSLNPDIWWIQCAHKELPVWQKGTDGLSDYTALCVSNVKIVISISLKFLFTVLLFTACKYHCHVSSGKKIRVFKDIGNIHIRMWVLSDQNIHQHYSKFKKSLMGTYIIRALYHKKTANKLYEPLLL